MFNLDNEARTWKHIEELVDETLARYKTTLEEDLDILERDEEAKEECKLGAIKRNCIIYRKNEKLILYFLKVCANKFHRLVKMKRSDALVEIESWNYLDENCKAYFRELCNLLTE